MFFLFGNTWLVVRFTNPISLSTFIRFVTHAKLIAQ